MSCIVVSSEVIAGKFGHSLHAQHNTCMHIYFIKEPEKEERNIAYANKARHV